MTSAQPAGGGGLAGRVAIVTGAGSGIGRATALALAAEGMAVACLDRAPDSAAETAALVAASGGRAVPIPVDVSMPVAVESAVSRCRAELGPPAVVVNAAGITLRKTALETSVEDWRRVIETNLSAYFYVLHAAVPAMAAAGGGAIVQVASVAAHVGISSTAYAAAKGGVVAMTRELASELAPLAIRINSISPGHVLTGMSADRMSQPAIREEAEAGIPLGRIGTAEDIARAIVFLAGPESGYVTGTDLVVDGGLISFVRRRDMPLAKPVTG
jgi:NAD(P)-dependent dehydrogenase (short-subunit alcohol dehydrogenase family)